MAQKSKGQKIKSLLIKRKSFIEKVKEHIKKIESEKQNYGVVSYWEKETQNSFINPVEQIDLKLESLDYPGSSKRMIEIQNLEKDLKKGVEKFNLK